MAVFKCKMCGANLESVENQSVATCEFCGTQQTLPKIDDEKKLALFNRANNLRLKSEFDKAAGIYESITAEFPDDAEAFWGLVLCKYGIEYVDDKDGRKIPTCHRTLPTSIMKDEDFQQACENADINAKAIYREEAKAIDGIQKKILEIAATEEPYDIFICYKETDDATGVRTEDSSIAQDIYTALTEKGYKVFYARNTLKKVAGTEYEPYIYAALSSAKIMLAIGTKFDYYDAVWVKNEWSRFISMMADDTSKILIPCYKNMDAYDIPENFSNMQALDMNDVTFFNNLEASTKNFLKTDTKVKSNTPANVNATNAENMVKRAYLLLEDKKFHEAKVFCNKALEFEPENAKAYLGSLMAENKARNIETLGKSKKKIEKNLNYAKVMRFGDEETKNKLTEANKRNKKHRTRRRIIKTSIALFMTLLLVLSIIIPTKIIAKSKFTDIVAISAGYEHTVALKSDGTVVAIGHNDSGQCDVSDWKDIVAVSAGNRHTVGLKSDGTVVAVGYNEGGKCDVDDWTDIVAIAAGDCHTVGLKSDGTVVAVGGNNSGQCDVSDWKDIVAVSAGNRHTVGLKSDGTVVAVGYNYFGQCDVSDWTDIVAISAGGSHTVGLKSDGTVVAVGGNNNGQCDVEYWTEIVAVSAGAGYTVGLKSDGTVVSVGYNYYGQCDVSDWTDIVAISAGGSHTVGLKSDGSVVAMGGNRWGECWVGDTSDYIKKYIDYLNALFNLSECTI